MKTFTGIHQNTEDRIAKFASQFRPVSFLSPIIFLSQCLTLKSIDILNTVPQIKQALNDTYLNQSRILTIPPLLKFHRTV